MMYIVKDNGNGTVTIDKKIYDELHKAACKRNTTEFLPLTPKLRESINCTIDSRIGELDKCEQTPWVEINRVANRMVKQLINSLPDGYPLPIEK